MTMTMMMMTTMVNGEGLQSREACNWCTLSPSNVAILQKIKCKGKTLQRYPPKDKVLQYMWREADVSKVKGKVA